MTIAAVGSQVFQYEHFDEVGKAAPVLFLHGWGRSGKEWLTIGEQVARVTKREVWVLDLPGFGGSPLPHEIGNIEQYTDLVIQFCRYMAIKKVTLVAHSLGGRVGIVWAAGKDKAVIEQLILVDPAGPKEFSLKRVLLSTLAGIFHFVPEGLRRALIAPLLDEDYRNTPELQKLYRVIVAKDLSDRLARINVPVTLLWGELDPVVPLKMVDVYRRYLRDVRVRVVWGAGHDPHLTQREQFVTHMMESLT